MKSRPQSAWLLAAFLCGSVVVPTLHLAFHDLIPHEHEGEVSHWGEEGDHDDHDHDHDQDQDHEDDGDHDHDGDHHHHGDHHHEPFDPHHGDGSLAHFSAALTAAQSAPILLPALVLFERIPSPRLVQAESRFAATVSVRGPPAVLASSAANSNA